MHLSINWGLDYERGLLLPLISLGEKSRQLHDDNAMFCAVGVMHMVSAKQENYFFISLVTNLCQKREEISDSPYFSLNALLKS